jgi:hypothetical protein
VGKNKFWQLVKAGEIELIGDSNKRWLVVASAERYVERQLAKAKQLAKARAEGPSQDTPRKANLRNLTRRTEPAQAPTS